MLSEFLHGRGLQHCNIFLPFRQDYRQSLLALHTIRLMIWFNTYVANLFASMLFIHLKLGIADAIPSFQWRFFLMFHIFQIE